MEEAEETDPVVEDPLALETTPVVAGVPVVAAPET